MKRKIMVFMLSAALGLGMTTSVYANQTDTSVKESVSVASKEDEEVLARGSSEDGTVSYVLYENGSAVISGTGTIDRSLLYSHIRQVKSVTIESGVTAISEDAFMEYWQLEEVSIPDSVEKIGSSAFNGCSALTSVNLPSGLTTIEDSLFCECSSLTSITIPEKVTAIGNYAFDGCTELASIIMPKSVESIGCCMLGTEYNANLAIQYGGTEDEWNNISVDSDDNEWYTDEDVLANMKFTDAGDKGGETEKVCNHSYAFNGWKEEANCQHPGTMIMKCTFCGDTMEQKGANLGDHVLAKTDAVAATCEKAGVTEGAVCTVCGKVITKATEIPALGHAWSSEGTVTKNATCAENGVRTYTCTREGCDQVKTESLGKLAPKVSAQRTTSSIYKCLKLRKITFTSSIENYEYAAVKNGKIGDITARGIIYADTKTLGSDELVIGANGSKAFAVPTRCITDKTFSWNIVPAGSCRQYTVRSWVQYKDSNGKTVYAFSEPLTVSYNSLR